MRFLLDENRSLRIGPLLIERGHQAVHVRDVGMRSAGDLQVLAKAAADGTRRYLPFR